MPSVVGLLEEHELAARRRVDGLCEEADRIQAELAAAEQEGQEWAIARGQVGTVLASDGGNIADGKAVLGRPGAACSIEHPVRHAALKIATTTATHPSRDGLLWPEARGGRGDAGLCRARLTCRSWRRGP